MPTKLANCHRAPATASGSPAQSRLSDCGSAPIEPRARKAGQRRPPAHGACAAAPLVTTPRDASVRGLRTQPARACRAVRRCRAATHGSVFFIGLRHSEDAWAEDGFTLVVRQIYNL